MLDFFVIVGKIRKVFIAKVFCSADLEKKKRVLYYPTKGEGMKHTLGSLWKLSVIMLLSSSLAFGEESEFRSRKIGSSSCDKTCVETGPREKRGCRGTTGPRGATGSRGQEGQEGPQGRQGKEGRQGQKGDA